jgi:pimeloyl-ACP methyl ester carboxylesterase
MPDSEAIYTTPDFTEEAALIQEKNMVLPYTIDIPDERMAARTYGANSRKSNCSPISCSMKVAPSAVVTATWIYHGKRLEGSGTFPSGTRVHVPTGVAALPDPVFLPPPRSFAEKTYDIVHWSEMPSGGHFATLEEPELMLADLRTFVATLSGERP